MTIPAIADTPDKVTVEWLTDALGHAGVLTGAIVKSLSMTPLGTGQMCDSFRISVTYSAACDAPATFVVKLPAADETSRATAKSLRNYEKEVRFYQEIVDTVKVRTPRAYYAEIDLETASFALLLGDLAPAQQGDQLAGCTPELAREAVRQLVPLHAPRWDDPTWRDVDWLYVSPDSQGTSMKSLLPMLWAGFQHRYAEVLEPEALAVGHKLFDNLDAYFAPNDTPITLIHGDYRLDNLLFTPGETPHLAGVVDWQTIAIGPALRDVAYFIGAGLVRDDRRPVEESLVREYFADLCAAGITGYSWDRCWLDYRRGTWAGLIMAIAAPMLVERTERGDHMFMAMFHRHAQQIIDVDGCF